MSSSSTRPARRLLVGVLGLSFATVAGAQTAPAAGSVPGLNYRVRVSMEIRGMPDFGGRGGGAPGSMFFLGRVSAAGGRTRIDVQAMEPTTGAFVAGDYILMSDSGAVVVQPDKSTYTAFRGLQGGSGGRGGRGGMTPMQVSEAQVRSLNITDSRVVMEKLGRDTVEGRQTQRYKVSYEFSVIMGTEPRTLQAENEIWASTEITTPLVNPLAPTGTSVGMFAVPSDTAGLAPGILRFARQMDSAMKQVEGIPVKTVTTMNLAGMLPPGMSMSGMDLTLVQTTTFSAITPGQVDPARFEIPAGFTRATPGG